MALEQAGVPTVAVHTHVFARLVRSVALANGVPTTRQAFVPQPIVGRSAAQLRDSIEGKDPISGRPFIQEVIEGLSAPLSEEDLEGTSFQRSTPRVLEPDTEDRVQALFNENHWTDHLPVILPTEERVARMLEGTNHAPDEVVGKLRPTMFREYWEFTVEKVAVNAVMAGAKPEYLPVILALAASGQTARSSSTNSFATFSVVNGPIRKEIEMGDGIGALGPYNHANATIGRAYSLLSLNLQGGSVPGDTYMGSLGNWYNYSATFAEAEERSPWTPFHVQHGFDQIESTASVFFGGWYTQAGYGPRATWQEKFKHSFAASEHYLPPVIVMDPNLVPSVTFLILRRYSKCDSNHNQTIRRDRVSRGACRNRRQCDKELAMRRTVRSLSLFSPYLSLSLPPRRLIFRRLLAAVARVVLIPLAAFAAQTANAQLTSAATFDIKRFSTAGEGWFETFYVEETEPLQAALDAGKVKADTALLVTETAAGKLALLRDQMAYHHIAQGTVDGKNWMATF